MNNLVLTSQLMPHRGNVEYAGAGSTSKQSIHRIGTQIFGVLVGTQIHQDPLLLPCLALVSLLILDECVKRKYAKNT